MILSMSTLGGFRMSCIRLRAQAPPKVRPGAFMGGKHDELPSDIPLNMKSPDACPRNGMGVMVHDVTPS
jgi:hypothetical protein